MVRMESSADDLA